MTVPLGEQTNETGRIRITYVISAINTECAGTEGHLLRLLGKLDKTCYQPQLVVMQRSRWTDQFRDPDIPLHVLNFKSFMRPRDWLVIARLARLLRRLRTQIVDLHFVDAHFAGALAARLAKIPVVISNRRDLGYHYDLKTRMMVQIGNRYVSRFVANANVVADRMSAMERLPRGRFEVIYNGIDLSKFDEDATRPTAGGFEEFVAGKRVVAIAANLRPVKRLDIFLESAAIVAEHVDDAVFVIMGDGRLRSTLQTQAERMKLTDRVLFLGSVPSTAPYLVRADVGCLSSESEGFSNSVVECMAARLPVVVTRVGGLPEAVLDGQTGYVVPPNDPGAFAAKLVAILELEDVALQEMRDAARRRVEELFSMESHLEAHYALYEREFRKHHDLTPLC